MPGRYGRHVDRLRLRLRPWPVTALVAWTFFCWGNRIPLLWSSSTQTYGEKVRGTIPIAVFLLLAVVAFVAVVRSGENLAGRPRTAALVLAVWSAGYWVVRLPFLLANPHPLAFKAVHTVLAAVSVGLGVWVWRRLGRRPQAEGTIALTAAGSTRA
jgi:hypothetical protein